MFKPPAPVTVPVAGNGDPVKVPPASVAVVVDEAWPIVKGTAALLLPVWFGSPA